MNGEKVKEIKIVLKGLVDDASNWLQNAMIGGVNLADILTLINELESENKKLNSELKRYKMDWLNSEKMHLQAEMEDTEFELFCANKSLGEVRAENKILKDRIAELEKEIEANAFYSKGYAQGIKNTYDVVLPDKLKQFAERLKDMPFNIEFTFKESSYEDIKKLANLMKEYLVKHIDKTLKEFINERKI